MSLADPDEEYEDLVPKRRGKGRLSGARSKAKLFLVILVIGIIIGIAFGHYYVEPLIGSITENTCSSCLETRDLLAQENDCLYQVVPDAQSALQNCTLQQS